MMDAIVDLMKTRNQKRIVIYRPSPFGRMYLCNDGTTSSRREDAAEHWGSQFRAVVGENWIVNTPSPARAEIVEGK